MDLNWLNPLFPIILKESRNNYSAFQNHKTGDDTHAVESFLTWKLFIYLFCNIAVKSF